MKRVFTDDRFPDAQIENDGSRTFVFMQGGQQVDRFTGVEHPEVDGVSPEFAQRRAEDYFNRMSTRSISSEMNARNWDSPTDKVTPLRRTSASDIDRSIAAARAEFDPAKRSEMEKRAIQMMAREEALAAQVVNHLLHDL